MSRAGYLRQFQLEAPQDTSDGAGGYTRDWTVLGALWGEFKALGAQEQLVGETGQARGRYRVTVRGAPLGAPSRPTPRQRFRLGSRLFLIETVQEADPAGKYLSCNVIEEVTV